MKATKTLIAAAVVAASISAPTFAVEGVSANVAASSDYLWRGMSQTAGDAAVSGGIDYDSGFGVYAGTWTSNVDGGSTTQEIDAYAGYAGEAGAIAYDVGYIYYSYNGGWDDFSELYGSATYDFVTVGVATLADSDNDAKDFADDFYYNVDLAFEVAPEIELGLHAGYYDVKHADNNMFDYNVTVSKGGFTFGLYKNANAVDGSIDDDTRALISYSLDIDL